MIDPTKVPLLIAGGLGAFLSVLFQRNASKIVIFTTLVTAEIIDYYFAQPAWALLHSTFSWADTAWQGPVALTIGLLSIFVVGGVCKVFEDFWAHPYDALADFVAAVAKRLFPGRGDK
jgi:hypothetical protein